MSNEITMPKLSDTMEEGKILRWLKHPGDKIARGEAIAEVETDKADMVLESFEEGVLDQIKLNEGESAPVGAVIATMKSAGAKESKPQAKSDAKPAAAKDSKPEPSPTKTCLDCVDGRSGRRSGRDYGNAQADRDEAEERREERDAPKKPISPAAVVTDGSAGDLHVHPAMSANLSARADRDRRAAAAS